VEDLDREVVTSLAQELLGLSQEDHSGAVVGIDDMVAFLEGALGRCNLDFEVDRFFDG
jgi:hypothetical protein